MEKRREEVGSWQGVLFHLSFGKCAFPAIDPDKNTLHIPSCSQAWRQSASAAHSSQSCATLFSRHRTALGGWRMQRITPLLFL